MEQEVSGSIRLCRKGRKGKIMPYYKYKKKCVNKSGEDGTFVTVTKKTGKEQCWKSKAAFERAAPAIYANESENVMSLVKNKLGL